MTLAWPARIAAVACCIATNAAIVSVAAPAVGQASVPSDAGFAPSTASAALDAVRRNEAHDAPACRDDLPDAIVDGRVHVQPGQTLCVRLRVDGARVQAVGLAAAGASPIALVVTARQEDERTFLTLVNPLPQSLRYRAWMHRPGTLGFAYTSSCPVMPDHRVGFEDWPYPIDELALGDFTLEPTATETIECR